MTPTFKDSTRATIRKYVHDRIVNGMAEKGITVDVLASWSGINTNRVADIVYESHNPTIDEACMIFTALGIPLDHLTAHINKLPYFQRKGSNVVGMGL